MGNWIAQMLPSVRNLQDEAEPLFSVSYKRWHCYSVTGFTAKNAN
jgi:hypothetical protein